MAQQRLRANDGAPVTRFDRSARSRLPRAAKRPCARSGTRPVVVRVSARGRVRARQCMWQRARAYEEEQAEQDGREDRGGPHRVGEARRGAGVLLPRCVLQQGNDMVQHRAAPSERSTPCCNTGRSPVRLGTPQCGTLQRSRAGAGFASLSGFRRKCVATQYKMLQRSATCCNTVQPGSAMQHNGQVTGAIRP